MTNTEAPVLSAERTDLLEALVKQRYFLRYTLRDLSDEQAALAPTASELCLGGLIKHVAETEEMWMNFAVGGAAAMSNDDWNQDSWNTRFQMVQTDTLESLFSEYDRVAARTDELLASLPDLDAAHPLPEAPWFEAGASWSVRRVILHVIAETAQHCGHADVIRETIDGAKSMG
jgi:uncharacterized damage-inducible protein DinB